MENLKMLFEKTTNKENIQSDLGEFKKVLDDGYEPGLLISPETVEEIVEIIKIANKYKVPVYPIGSGSQFTRGVPPFTGGVLLSTKNLNKIIEYRPKNMSVEVEAGLTTQDLQKALAKDNIFYPIETINNNTTIGGQVAINGFGRKKYLYQSTRNYVMGMEFISPEGEIVRVGGRTVKNVSSYDISQLLTGSWGTLGIITKVTLRVKPIPEKKINLRIKIDSLLAMSNLLIAILKEKVSLASLMFQQVNTQYIMYLELEGFAETIELQAQQLIDNYNLIKTDDIWEEQCFSGQLSLGLDKYREILEEIDRLSKEEKVTLISQGNITNGVLQFNMLEENEAFLKKLAEISHKLAGTLVYKDKVLVQKNRGKNYLALVRAIKNNVDPQNVLVPESLALKE